MWQDIRLLQVNLLINRLSPCVDIWLKHGGLREFPMYLRWIMKWLLQGEDDIPIASPKSFDFTCFWASIWYSSHRENRVEMPLLRVLMRSGKRECSEDIIALPFLPLKRQVSDSCSIIIMRNHIGVLPKKNMAQDSQGCLETASGNPLDICQRDLTLINTWILTVTLISLLQGEGSLLFEKLTLMVKLRSMGLLISSGENLKGNMLLLLSLLIERNWLLNKKIRLLSLSLFQLRVTLLLLCFQLQKRRLKVYYVIRFLSIRNQFTMLLVQSTRN